jgi:hypothetical protein
MPKKYYSLAIVAFLMIPVFWELAAMLSVFINPEIAAGHPNYVRNYRLLDLAKTLVLRTSLLASAGSWFLTCLFLVKSKKQSYAWSCLAILGPYGLVILSMLRDRAPAPGDLYQQYLGRLKLYLRVAQEFCLFVIVSVVSYHAIVLKRDLMIAHESAVTGIPIEQIIDQQNASGGMWAFSEGLQEFYLVALFYLLWPICFNAIGHLPKLWDSIKRA